MKLFPNQKMANSIQRSIEAKNFNLLCSRELLVVYCGFPVLPFAQVLSPNQHTSSAASECIQSNFTKKKLNTEAMRRAHP